MIRAILSAVVTVITFWIGYRTGRNNVIHQLFSGERDFKQYLGYRRQEAEKRAKAMEDLADKLHDPSEVPDE